MTRFLGGITRGKKKIDFLKRMYIKKYTYDEMVEAYNVCDVIIEGYSGPSWDFTGSMKEKEACACGIPMILEEGEARKEIFGRKYPLFMPRGSMRKDFADYKNLLIKKLILLRDKKYYNEISNCLIKRSRQYSLDEGALYLKNLVAKILERHNG